MRGWRSARSGLKFAGAMRIVHRGILIFVLAVVARPWVALAISGALLAICVRENIGTPEALELPKKLVSK